MYYGDHFLQGQIIEAIKPLEISQIMFVRTKKSSTIGCYDISTNQFLGLYETIGYIVVKRDDDKYFLNYGFCVENSKVSYHKHRIPNSFAGTLSTRHRLLFETGQLEM